MTVSKKDPAEAGAPIHSVTETDPAARADKRAGDEIADRDLDSVSGGPTAVERNHTPT